MNQKTKSEISELRYIVLTITLLYNIIFKRTLCMSKLKIMLTCNGILLNDTFVLFRSFASKIDFVQNSGQGIFCPCYIFSVDHGKIIFIFYICGILHNLKRYLEMTDAFLYNVKFRDDLTESSKSPAEVAKSNKQ